MRRILLAYILLMISSCTAAGVPAQNNPGPVATDNIPPCSTNLDGLNLKGRYCMLHKEAGPTPVPSR